MSLQTIPAKAQHRREEIARVGSTIPGEGSPLTSINVLSINSSGQVLIDASNTGVYAQRSTYLWSEGVFTRIAGFGQTIPDGSATINRMNTRLQNTSGQVAFQASLSDSQGLFLGNGSSLIQIAKAGQLTPDGRNTFSEFQLRGISNSGAVDFSATLSGSQSGYFRYDRGVITSLARSGDALPSGGTMALNPIADMATSTASGQLVFNAQTGFGNSHVLAHNGVAFVEVARSGGASIDGDGTIAQIAVARELTGLNHVLLSGSLVGTHSGRTETAFYRASVAHGLETQIFRTGASSPFAPGIIVSGIASLDSLGRSVYAAELASDFGGPTTGAILVRNNGVSSNLLARSGQLAPDSSSRFASFGDISMNNSFAVFSATLDSSSSSGYYATDGIDMVRIQATGDLLGGERVFGVYTLVEENPLNELGQFAYTALTGALGRTEHAMRWTPDLTWRTTADGVWDNQANWTLSIKPAYVHDMSINTTSDVTVTGPAFSTAVRSLSIGGGSGQSTLDLQAGATLFATNGVLIKSNGVLTGQGAIAGNVTNEGTVVARDLTFRDSLVNNALIRGNGHVAGNIVNTATGTIRVDSGSSILLDGIGFQNSGNVIVNSGGQLDLRSDLWNSSGAISVQDGGTVVLGGSFTGASANTVSLAPEGRALLVGRMDNTGSSATLGKSWTLQGGTITGGTINATDLAIQSGYMSGVHVTSGLDVNLSSSWLRLSEGSSVDGNIHVGNNGLLIFGQNFVLGSGQHLTLGNAATSELGYAMGEFGNTMYFANGSTIEGNGWVNFKSDGTSTVIDGILTPGFSAGTISLVNDIVLGSSSNTIIELGGLGNFDHIDVYGSLMIDDGLLDVRLMDGFVLGDGMSFQFLTTFNGDRTGFFRGLGQNSLVGIFGSSRLYIDYTSGDGNDVRLFSITAVPEPSSLVLAALVMIGCVLIRKHPIAQP